MGEFVEVLRKYWHLFVVALLMGYGGYRLWPAETDSAAPPARVGALQDHFSNFGRERQDEPRSLEPEATEQETSVGEQSPVVIDPSKTVERRELLEVLIPVIDQGPTDVPEKTLTQDSPQVQAALAQLKVDLYGPVDGEEVKKAKLFLTHNGIKFSFHDTGEVMERERARRAAGNGVETAVIVDDQIIRSYSDEAMQQALSAATQRQIEASK